MATQTYKITSTILRENWLSVTDQLRSANCLFIITIYNRAIGVLASVPDYEKVVGEHLTIADIPNWTPLDSQKGGGK